VAVDVVELTVPGRGRMPNMRSICAPFVVAPPAGAQIRTRLRLILADQTVLRAVGEYLGGLAGTDLAWRCSWAGVGSSTRPANGP
jgi:hypothetical protein